MEMSPEAKLAIKNALNGVLSDDYNELETLLQDLNIEKSTTTNHGTFKRIDGVISKVQSKINRLKK